MLEWRSKIIGWRALSVEARLGWFEGTAQVFVFPDGGFHNLWVDFENHG